MGNHIEVYLDNLNLFSFIKLLCRNGLKTKYKINVLDINKKTVYSWILTKFFQVDIKLCDFKASNLVLPNGKLVPFAAREISGQLAIAAAEELIKNNKLLSVINNKFKKNAALLYLARSLHIYMEYWVLRILAVKCLSDGNSSVLYIQKSNRFDYKILEKHFDEKVIYYKKTQAVALKQTVKFLLVLFKLITSNILSFFIYKSDQDNKTYNNKEERKPGLLLLNEDDIHNGLVFRNELYWLLLSKNTKDFNTVVLKVNEHNVIDIDDNLKKKLNLELIESDRHASRVLLNKQQKRSLNFIIYKALKLFVKAQFTYKSRDRYSMLLIANLLLDSYKLTRIIYNYNIKTFLFRDSGYRYIDAIVMTEKLHHVKTISQQYSIPGIISPVLMAVSSSALIFADKFKSMYQYKDISPDGFNMAGYLYDAIPEYLTDRVASLRNDLSQKSVNFVISYFDESVAVNKWGAVGEHIHLDIFRNLAQLVIDEPSIAVIIKSKYIRNIPSIIYSDDETIQRAVATGRFIESRHGEHRNVIYPAEAALCSDICIGNKFGATAAVEGVLLGKRSILINYCGYSMDWEDIYKYNKNMIEFDSINSALSAIIKYKAKEPDYMQLGDWSSFVDKIDAHRDAKYIERLNVELALS